jgi:hypothetical protein
MTPSEKIDTLIAGLDDWRGPVLQRLREIFHEVDPDVQEDWKWMGSPVWSHDGILAVGIPFKTSVKLGFLYGAALPDPDNVFNAELDGTKRRAIKYYERDTLNEASLKVLIASAIAYNQAQKSLKK